MKTIHHTTREAAEDVRRVEAVAKKYQIKSRKIVPTQEDCLDLAPCDFCLFPKLRGCRYETIKEIKEGVTKVIDTRTQEDFHGAFQKLLERYKCIAAGGDYFEGDLSFMCVLSIKVPIRKKVWKLI